MEGEELKELFRQIFIKCSEIDYKQHKLSADIREIVKEILNKLNIDFGQMGE